MRGVGTFKARGSGNGWVQRSLQLSLEQKRELLALGQHFVSVIGRLRLERQQMISQLHLVVRSPLPWLPLAAFVTCIPQRPYTWVPCKCCAFFS